MANYLVTGAGGGMGSALCNRLSAEGHRVWGLDRPEAKAEEGCRLIPADLTDPAALDTALLRVRKEAGQLDGIIHMAGIYDLNSLIEMPEEDFLGDFNVNLFGMFRVNRLFVPLLRKGGRIVIVSSELAPLSPLPFTGVYAITKGAVEKYAAALRMELQLLGISVIVIRPGAVKTGMLPVSTAKLDRFCAETKLYSLSAARFKTIVDRIEARNVPPDRIAQTVSRALGAKRPRLRYCVNRNPLLLLFSALPERAQLWIIRKVLQ